MAYEIPADSAVVTNEQLVDDELAMQDIAQRWVEYCALPPEARSEFAEWGDGVIRDASKLSNEGVLRVYDMMHQLAPAVHAAAQDRFTARREELARQAEAEAALAAQQRLGNVTWRAAVKLQRMQTQL